MGLFSKKRTDATSAGAPPGVVFEVWGQRGWANVEVVGESHYAREIRGLLPARIGEGGQEVIVPVRVTRDEHNSHDKNAIVISGSTGVLGYLSREDASRYAPVFAVLQAQGLIPVTTARVWGGDGYTDAGKPGFVGSVRVDLADPHMLVPANIPPAGRHTMLPVGRALQVTGEQDHLPAVAPYLNPNGECWVHATLHEIVDHAGRTAKTFVEVQIDGQPVGRLTPKMSGDMLPVINYLGKRGRITAVRATVKGNALQADVALHNLRSSELPAAWFGDNDTNENESATSDGVEPSDPASVTSVSPHPAESTIKAHSSEEGHRNPAPPLPPADWYPDPRAQARLRYWDGSTWTEHTAP